MKLVVGLGNPGKDYQGTRHNVGFDVVAALNHRHGAGRPKSKFKAEVVETSIGGCKTVLVCPLTYMNLSGQSVKAAVDFYKLGLQDLIVICDDLALELGRLRIRPSGSAGGQKGLANVIDQLGSDQVTRLRVGIGRPKSGVETVNHVLQTFSKKEQPEIDVAIQRAADAVEIWIREGVEAAMNRYNPDPSADPAPETKTNRNQN